MRTTVSTLGVVLGANEYLADQTSYMDKEEKSIPVYLSAPGYSTIEYAMKQSPEKFFNGPLKKINEALIVGEDKVSFIRRNLISKFNAKGISPDFQDIDIAVNGLCTQKPCIAFLDISKLKKIPISPVSYNRNGTSTVEEYLKEMDLKYINDFFSSSSFQETKYNTQKQIGFTDLATLARFIPQDAIQVISIPDIFEIKQRLALKKGFVQGDKVNYETIDVIEKNNIDNSNEKNEGNVNKKMKESMLNDKIKEYIELGLQLGLFDENNLSNIQDKLKNISITEDNSISGDAEAIIKDNKKIIKINNSRFQNKEKYFMDEVIFHELTHFANEIHQDLYGNRTNQILQFKQRYSEFSKDNPLIKYPEWGAILLDEAISQKVAQAMCQKKYGMEIYPKKGYRSKLIDEEFVLYSDFSDYPEYDKPASDFAKTIVGKEGLMGLAKLSMKNNAIKTIYYKYLKEKDGAKKLYNVLGYMGNIAIAYYASKGHFIVPNSEENRTKQSVLESMQRCRWIMEDIINPIEH